MAGRVCNYHSAYNFRVEIPGFADAYFKTVSGLRQEVEVEEIREGGNLLPTKLPGVGNVPNVTFERGRTNDESIVDWFTEIADFANGVGADPCDDSFKRNIAVVQLNRRGEEIKRYTLINAFPVAIEHGEWDNDSTDKVIETMEVAYDFLRIT